MSKVIAYFAARKFNRVDALWLYSFGWLLATGHSWIGFGVVLVGATISVALESSDDARKTTGASQ